jgi:hypothetical protein
MSIYAFIYINMYMYMYVGMSIYAYVHTCIYISIYIYTYTITIIDHIPVNIDFFADAIPLNESQRVQWSGPYGYGPGDPYRDGP